MAFNGLVWWWFGSERALEFSAGYVIEAALAVDNIFVFVVIFSGFGIPDRYQHRVLFWGSPEPWLCVRSSFLSEARCSNSSIG